MDEMWSKMEEVTPDDRQIQRKIGRKKPFDRSL
jgi:hypothetical protein